MSSLSLRFCEKEQKRDCPCEKRNDPANILTNAAGFPHSERSPNKGDKHDPDCWDDVCHFEPKGGPWITGGATRVIIYIIYFLSFLLEDQASLISCKSVSRWRSAISNFVWVRE
jgi:hypothetical protein